MLKLEEKMRFQEGHKNDCVEMDVQKFGAGMYDFIFNEIASHKTISYTLIFRRFDSDGYF